MVNTTSLTEIILKKLSVSAPALATGVNPEGGHVERVVILSMLGCETGFTTTIFNEILKDLDQVSHIKLNKEYSLKFNFDAISGLTLSVVKEGTLVNKHPVVIKPILNIAQLGDFSTIALCRSLDRSISVNSVTFHDYEQLVGKSWVESECLPPF